MPVYLLSSYLMSPRIGHLEQALHCFAYLKKYNRSKMVFDDSCPNFDNTSFFKHGLWEEYYPDAKEPIPSNAPEARGNPVTTSCFVDADHAGCKVTRRSHTGYIIFLNRAPIMWFSKKQNTVETSTFSSELIALRACLEGIISLRYKLKMFGVAIDGQADILCDNLSVVKNTSIMDYKLHKKNNSLAFHAV